MLQAQFVILPAIIAIFGLAAVLSGLSAHREARKRRDYFWSQVGPGFVLSACVVVGVLVVLIIALVPFNARYYFITAHTGVVSTVSNQFVNGSGDNTSQSFIVMLEGDETPYELTDNRASVLDEKDITLNCTTEFVWAGADRMNCVIGEVR